MATVKILYNDSAEILEKYLKGKEGKDMPQTEHSCFLDGMTKEFTQVQSSHNSKGNNALHLIQSWSPAESRTLTAEKVHEMGVEMAKRFAPDHQFVVQTHTDQAHTHNHIVINPVHMETGKRIQNKFENLYQLRDINDAIAKERGLSVLPRQEKLTRPGPNEKSRRIEAYRGRSYIVDLANKANFARGHATNYDEYLSLLSGFNIQARIENQNITYFYPGREVGKRGRNLDPALDKPGLELKFAENLQRYSKSPELRATLLQSGSQDGVRKSGSELTPELTTVGGLVSKRADEMTQTKESVLQQSVIPLEEIQKAKTQSILKYCDKEKIRTTQSADGKTVLKDREHVELSEYAWTNHKNKTQGTLIDFVANHRSTSLLHAVSIINNNPNLMLLEQHAGEITRTYRTFTIPKEDSAPRAEAARQIAIFLNHKATQTNQYASLFKSQGIQVTRSNAIRFFQEKNQTGYLEYIPVNDGQYRKQIRGEISSPFLKQKGSGPQLSIYLEPRSLLTRHPNAFEKDPQRREGILVLLEPNIAMAHQAIATQKNIKRVKVIQNPLESASPESSRFFEDLRESLNPFSIDTELAWEAPSLEQTSNIRNPTLDKNFDLSRT
jgi:hypothetical protein